MYCVFRRENDDGDHHDHDVMTMMMMLMMMIRLMMIMMMTTSWDAGSHGEQLTYLNFTLRYTPRCTDFRRETRLKFTYRRLIHLAPHCSMYCVFRREMH